MISIEALTPQIAPRGRKKHCVIFNTFSNREKCTHLVFDPIFSIWRIFRIWNDSISSPSSPPHQKHLCKQSSRTLERPECRFLHRERDWKFYEMEKAKTRNTRLTSTESIDREMIDRQRTNRTWSCPASQNIDVGWTVRWWPWEIDGGRDAVCDHENVFGNGIWEPTSKLKNEDRGKIKTQITSVCRASNKNL